MSQSTDKTGSKKIWWIIILLPIGLAVGTVTSIIHHLRQNEEAESQKEFKVAVALNAKDISTGMQHALILGRRKLDSKIGRKNAQAAIRFIQGAVSPAGTGMQFTEKKVFSVDAKNFQLAYTDIPGSTEENIVAVVIETVGGKTKAEAAKLGISSSLIRSLTEAQPRNTIRFVLTPNAATAQEHAKSLTVNTLSADQKIVKTIVLKAQDEVKISDANNWKLTNPNSSALSSITGATFAEITHPILLSEPISEITPSQSKAALKAADQLRNIVLTAANEEE